MKKQQCDSFQAGLGTERAETQRRKQLHWQKEHAGSSWSPERDRSMLICHSWGWAELWIHSMGMKLLPKILQLWKMAFIHPSRLTSTYCSSGMSAFAPSFICINFCQSNPSRVFYCIPTLQGYSVQAWIKNGCVTKKKIKKICSANCFEWTATESVLYSAITK